MKAAEQGHDRVSPVERGARDLHELTVTEAASRIRARQLSPEDLLEALLARIDAVEPHVEAWAHLDRDGARAAARAAGDEARRGIFRGPLHGVPIGLKDIIHAAGLPTEANSGVLKGFVPRQDATVVTRLRAAGAVILGKLTTAEFAASTIGPKTHNPWNLNHTPGGSSSGSAAAVASAMVPGAFGSQTGGSIIRPSAYCGIVGLKATYGRISLHGVIPCAWTQDHLGPMTRSVADAALLFQTTAGHDPLDPCSATAPVPDCLGALTRRRQPRIGLARDYFFDRAAREVVDATERAVARLASAGAEVREVRMPRAIEAAQAAVSTIMQSESAAYHRQYLATRADRYHPWLRARLEAGSLIPAECYLQALRIRLRFRRDVEEALTGLDAIATPAAPTVAPRTLASTGDPVFQNMWTMAGVPTITLPCGHGDAGLPLGLQLVGRALGEAALFSTAAWCEEVLGPATIPSVR